MLIAGNIIVNADDLGLSPNVNNAILKCYEAGYINSSSVLTNADGFKHSVKLIQKNPCMINIGVHINMADGRPLTPIGKNFLTEQGNWDFNKTNKLINSFTKQEKKAFENEINAQISRAISTGIKITHIDSHYHLHTLPCFHKLFINAAQKFKLKLRLAQTYNEGNYLKYWYRKYLNFRITSKGLNYSDYFESVNEFVKLRDNKRKGVTEIMLHPGLDANGFLTDHYDAGTMFKWLEFIKQNTL